MMEPIIGGGGGASKKIFFVFDRIGWIDTPNTGTDETTKRQEKLSSKLETSPAPTTNFFNTDSELRTQMADSSSIVWYSSRRDCWCSESASKDDALEVVKDRWRSS